MNITEPVDAIDTRTRVYPSPPNASKNWMFIDSALRDDLNPTDALDLYTATVTGAGSVVMQSAKKIRLTTGALATDSGDVVATLLTLSRDASVFSGITKITVRLLFDLSGNVTNKSCFIGLLEDSAAQTAIPTTARHLGIQFVSSSSANFFLTSADGTTQVTTDTGHAADTSLYMLKIEWTGEDEAKISFFASTDLVNPIAEVDVTSFENGATSRGILMHMIMDNLAAESERIELQEWAVDWD